MSTMALRMIVAGILLGATAPSAWAGPLGVSLYGQGKPGLLLVTFAGGKELVAKHHARLQQAASSMRYEGERIRERINPLPTTPIGLEQLIPLFIAYQEVLEDPLLSAYKAEDQASHAPDKERKLLTALSRVAIREQKHADPSTDLKILGRDLFKLHVHFRNSLTDERVREELGAAYRSAFAALVQMEASGPRNLTEARAAVLEDLKKPLFP